MDPFLLMARPGRFELPTPWFEAKYSIQLSYRRIVFIHYIPFYFSKKYYVKILTFCNWEVRMRIKSTQSSIVNQYKCRLIMLK